MIRSEVQKAAATPATLALLAAAVVLACLATTSTLSTAEGAALGSPLREQQFFLLAAINTGLCSVLAGIRSFTDEFRYGSIAWLFLSSRSRTRVLAAKAAAMAFIGSVIGVSALAASVAFAEVIERPAFAVSGSDAAAASGFVFGIGVWAVLGVAVGGLVRHQVAAAVIALVWVLLIENLGSVPFGGASRYLPGQALHAVAGADSGAVRLSTEAGVGVAVAWALVLFATAAMTLSRRPLELSAT